MQLVYIFFIIAVFILIVWLMGSSFLRAIQKNSEDALFLGFFIYFSVFEILAFPLIMTLKPLSYLTYIWAFLIGILCIYSILYFILKKRNRNIRRMKVKKLNLPFMIMLLLLVIQTSYMVMHSQDGWDAAYYIPNVVQAIDTDTMYVYMNGDGFKTPNIYVRYAISSFFMHDAVLGQFFRVHGAIICRWFNTVVCSIFSSLIVYKMGLLLFKKKEAAYHMISIWVLANMGVGAILFPNAFLMERAYEGKAFCNNIVLPAVIYIFLKIYQNPNENLNWIELFWVNMASVAISSSSLAVVPVLNGCLFIGHLSREKRIKDVGKMFICILPSVAYFLIYALYQYGGLKVIIP